MNNPKYCIVHCSDVSQKEIFDQYKSINAYHRDERGFPQSTLGDWIGYHYLITGETMYKCKEDFEVGAHCNFVVDGVSMNYQSIGVCIGFDGDIELPIKPHLDLFKSLIEKIMKKYDIPIERVVFHRDFDNKGKTCPGTLFTRDYMLSILRPVDVVKVEPCNDAKLIIEKQNSQISNLQKFIEYLLKHFKL